MTVRFMRHAALALFAALFVTAGPALAAKPEIYTGFLSNTAVGGYDAVAYFTEGKAVEGSSDHTVDYRGATWRFANAENLTKFEENPEAYAPQYGGYCAYAVAKGTTAAGDPELWRIVDGKLYLNVNKQALALWEQDIPGHIARADVNWPGVLN